MNSQLLSDIGLYATVAIFFATIFILPFRKLPEEKEKKSLHSERCTSYWKAMNGFLVSGGTPARIAFYENFFVVARVTIAKFYYHDIKSAIFRPHFILNKVTLNFGKGRTLIFYTWHISKIQTLIEARIDKNYRTKVKNP
jgi:hypothetical protein